MTSRIINTAHFAVFVMLLRPGRSHSNLLILVRQKKLDAMQTQEKVAGVLTGKDQADREKLPSV